MSWFDLSRFTGRLRPGTTIVRVSGGLANQMLCYKLGRYLAEMRKEKLILDASSYDRDPPDRNRNFQLTKYPIRYDELVESKVAMRRLDERNPLTFISREMCAVHSTAERADLIQRIQSAPILLCDLWLSLALREELDDAARRNGTLDDLTLEWQKWFDDRDRELLSLIKSSADPVAIHVRRGDFATHDGNLLVTADYYNASIAEITGRLPEALFVVFSDDIPWCRTNLRLDTRHRFVDWHDDSTAFKDMYLASQCAHFILSNESTFSHQFVQLSQARSDRILIRSTMKDLERNVTSALR